MSVAVSIRLTTRLGSQHLSVTFDDGYTVVFFPAEGAGEPNSIAEIKIENSDERPVARFFSPHQDPITRSGIAGFQPIIEPHMPPEKVATYLQKAVATVNSRKGQGFEKHRRIVQLATREIEAIGRGDFSPPAGASCPE